jgi:predicted DNA-binding transcriptional regulator YafY
MEAILGFVVIVVLVWAFGGIKWLIGLLILIAVGVYALVKASDDDQEEEPEKPRRRRKSAKSPIPVRARLKIRYLDSDGAESQREIHAHGYVDSSPGYIEARCLVRKSNRTFRTDRIVEAVDMETGEVIKRIPTFMRSKRVT